MAIRYQKRNISNIFRFTDDLCVDLEFDRDFKNIYLSQLQLEKENISTSEASHIDLSIITENKKFKIQLYDKKDAFPLAIVSMPHLDSNIPLNVYYESTGSKILWFGRATS